MVSEALPLSAEAFQSSQHFQYTIGPQTILSRIDFREVPRPFSNQRNTCKDETPTRLSHTTSKERTQEQQKGLKTCTFTETQIAQGVPEPHVSPSPSEQDVMFFGAILRSWDVLCSSCSRVPVKDSLVEHGVLSRVAVASTSHGGCLKSLLVLLRASTRLQGMWPGSLQFSHDALFLQVSCCGVRSELAGCVRA